MKTAIALAFTITAALIPAVQAQDQRATQAGDQNVFVTGGRFIDGYIEDSFALFDDHYEDNFFAGVGYQHFLYSYGVVSFGAEAGLGVRLGAPENSAEVWAGFVTRFDLIDIAGFHISPALTTGLSLASAPVGSEPTRAENGDDDLSPLLYYFGPEISVSHDALPDWEVLARIQHRSGGWGSIANIDASNAVTVGLRYKF